MCDARGAHGRAPRAARGHPHLVTASFARVGAAGTGAPRPRRVHESAGSLRAVVEDLARRTEESWA